MSMHLTLPLCPPNWPPFANLKILWWSAAGGMILSVLSSSIWYKMTVYCDSAGTSSFALLSSYDRSPLSRIMDLVTVFKWSVLCPTTSFFVYHSCKQNCICKWSLRHLCDYTRESISIGDWWRWGPEHCVVYAVHMDECFTHVAEYMPQISDLYCIYTNHNRSMSAWNGCGTVLSSLHGECLRLYNCAEQL